MKIAHEECYGANNNNNNKNKKKKIKKIGMLMLIISKVISNDNIS